MISVSVIIPFFDAQKHLEECIRSVCDQTLKNIEIICVDDGSTDDSAEIVARLSKEDARIRYVRQENSGAGAARNAGLALARGKYLSFLDADDFFDERMLELAFCEAERCSAQIVVYGSDRFNNRSRTYRRLNYTLREDMFPPHRPFAATDIKDNIFESVCGWAWDKLFLTDFVRDNELSFQEVRTTNDLLFTYMAFVKACRISTVPTVLAHQRRNSFFSLSVTREKSWIDPCLALTALREKLMAWGLYDRFERDFVNYALHFLLWSLNTLKPVAAKAFYGKLLEFFKSLGIADYPRDKFYYKGEYLQYLLIMKLPYNPCVQFFFGCLQRFMTEIRRRFAIDL